MSWPTNLPADALAIPDERENHLLEVFLNADGEIEDAHLDTESFWPAWFKVEFKGNGELSAKVHGLRLSTRFGDKIVFHRLERRAP